jgi:biopolymer transport protein ExbB
MRRYASSKFRLIVLMAVLIAAGVLVRQGFAQSSTAPASSSPQGAGLFQMIIGNLDPVFFTIFGLSIIGLTLIIQGFIKNRASVLMPENTTQLIREMIAQHRFKELMDFTENDPSFISRAINPALKRAPNFTIMKEAMETAISEQTAEQFRRIEYLNIIGNLGPLLGLLGTVLGMIHAFSQMQATGGTRPQELAGGISTALTHTFLGLMLAVPCLAAFGVLRTIVDRLTVRGALISEELLLMMRPTDARAAASPAQAGAAPRATPQPMGSQVMPPPPPPAGMMPRKSGPTQSVEGVGL